MIFGVIEVKEKKLFLIIIRMKEKR